MKNCFLKRKKLISFLSVVLLIVFIITLHNYLGGYNYESDIDCINSEVTKHDYVDNIVFKYENDNQEIIMYQSKDKAFWTGWVYKRTVNGITRYKFKHTATIVPYNNVTKEVRKLGCFKYVAVDTKDEIKDFNFGKYEPEEFEIKFTNQRNEYIEAILYIADTSKRN